jgi:hypothetical protein
MRSSVAESDDIEACQILAKLVADGAAKCELSGCLGPSSTRHMRGQSNDMPYSEPEMGEQPNQPCPGVGYWQPPVRSKLRQLPI